MDMEIDMFFYKTDLKSFLEAQAQKGGLAVIKTWLKSEDGTHENVFGNLEKNVHKVQSPNSTTTIDPIRLPGYQAAFTPGFLFYEGSLEYPPCSESVTWFINDTGIPLTKNLVNEFRKIKLAEGDVTNLRPTQQLNKRRPLLVLSGRPEEEYDRKPIKPLK